MPDLPLASTFYVDYADPAIQTLADTLGAGGQDDQDYARAAFEHVRDNIPHTAETGRQIVTAKASDVLAAGTGICHAKANLLAALLRAGNIPAGFGFQHLTLGDDDQDGYCLHGFVVAFIGGRPTAMDPHPGVAWSTTQPMLWFPNRPEYDEYTFDGWWAEPDSGTMDVLAHTATFDQAWRALPDQPSDPPAGSWPLAEGSPDER